MLLNWELNIAMSGSFRTKFTCYSGFQTQQRIYAFSNDQEHPHDQRLLESVINRETSVVGGKNLLVVMLGTKSSYIKQPPSAQKILAAAAAY